MNLPKVLEKKRLYLIMVTTKGLQLLSNLPALIKMMNRLPKLRKRVLSLLVLLNLQLHQNLQLHLKLEPHLRLKVERNNVRVRYLLLRYLVHTLNYSLRFTFILSWYNEFTTARRRVGYLIESRSSVIEV